MQPEATYFGYQVNKEGVRPLPEKAEFIENVLPPQYVTEPKSFLGLINYHKHLPNFLTILEPLQKLLRKNEKWDQLDQLRTAITNFELNNESAFEDDITLTSNNKFPTEQDNLAPISSEDSKIESENSTEQLATITTPTPEIMPITAPVNNHNEMNTNGDNLNSAPMLRQSERIQKPPAHLKDYLL